MGLEAWPMEMMGPVVLTGKFSTLKAKCRLQGEEVSPRDAHSLVHIHSPTPNVNVVL